MQHSKKASKSFGSFSVAQPNNSWEERMESSRIESLVKAAIPGADVSAKVEDRMLHLTAVFEAKSLLDAHKRILDALWSAGKSQEYLFMKILWFGSKREWGVTEAKKAVIAALQPVASRAQGMDHFIHVSVDEYKLSIDIEKHDGLSSDQARDRVLAMSESLLALVDLKHISLHVASGASLFLMPAFDRVDDDDDDMNPNWPSKTGNPSGGGRGNNPPRR